MGFILDDIVIINTFKILIYAKLFSFPVGFFHPANRDMFVR